MPATPSLTIIRRCAIFCLVVLVAACVSAPPRGAVVEDRNQENAQQAFDRGDYRKAAELWQLQAVNAEEPAASSLRVRAANAWLLAGEPGSARALIRWIEDDQLADSDTAVLNLALAELSLEENRPVEARQYLDRIGSALPEHETARYRVLSAEVESELGSLSTQSVQAARDMAGDIAAYDADAALSLMRQLEQVPSGQLAYLALIEKNPAQAAWFDLAWVLRSNLVDGKDLEPSVRSWKSRHPGADLTEAQALDLWLRYRQAFRPPARVAVLLPESGGLTAAAAAVRDGILVAYLEQPGGAEVRFYGTGEDPDSVLAGYFEAADDGADWIIGPLDRSSVEALLNLAGLATPVLALNELPDRDGLTTGLAQQVFGISLSQDREASAVGRKMAGLGFQNVAILAPDNTWGDRIASAFREHFLHEGGTVLVEARYLPGENDHSQVLEQILRIDESKARKKRLEDRLGIELEFEPVRRSDLDAIFVAATPEQGRLLAPQLRFFDAGDIPTFTTSRVFAGIPDPPRNQDLDGLNLPLTPWQIRHPTQRTMPRLSSLREGQFGPLFAIGIDAWNIL
ncbi:MAG: penicillin-binding protein activator, partial [Xanthomonadales bacterium]|nr:penicillin-binding protein activator [Xanthomonadales bacterium]